MKTQYLHTVISLEQLKTYIKMIYGLTQIPAFILDQNWSPVSSWPEIPLLEQLDFRGYRSGIPGEQSSLPYLHTESEIYTCAHQSFSLDHAYTLFLGPCRLGKTTSNTLSSFALFGGFSLDEVSRIAQYMPLLRRSYMQRTLQLYSTLISGKYLDVQSTAQYRVQDLIADLPSAAEETLFERRETAEFHTPYIYEKRQMEAVRCGDLEKLPEIIDAMEMGKPGILARDSLRQAKNMLIAAVTLITRAAMEGGLPEEAAYAMSDSFIQKSEDAIDLEQVNHLITQAFYDFTEQVGLHKKEYTYSRPVEITLQYIHRHLHDDLTLTVLSKEAGLSPSQLSRNFKKETGTALSVYIQKERIHAAQNMLRFSDYTPAQISNYLNFATQSYFIDVFKKHTGMTPLQYRKTAI